VQPVRQAVLEVQVILVHHLLFKVLVVQLEHQYQVAQVVQEVVILETAADLVVMEETEQVRTQIMIT
jgi:hypothetical protein